MRPEAPWIDKDILEKFVVSWSASGSQLDDMTDKLEEYGLSR